MCCVFTYIYIYTYLYMFLLLFKYIYMILYLFVFFVALLLCVQKTSSYYVSVAQVSLSGCPSPGPAAVRCPAQ